MAARHNSKDGKKTSSARAGVTATFASFEQSTGSTVFSAHAPSFHGLQRPDWERWPKTAILNVRFCDLGLRLEDSPVACYMDRLRSEISLKGLTHFRPRAYLGTDWGCVNGSVLISVPFYVASPKLAKIEYDYSKDYDGFASFDSFKSENSLMRYLRHEAGHAFDHAYRVSSRKDFRSVFGRPTDYYFTLWYRKDSSRFSHFATNIEVGLGQAHPCEDFAETFALWLRPGFNWRRKYASRPKVLRKFLYIEKIVREVACRPPKYRLKTRTLEDVSRLKRTLSAHYDRRYRDHERSIAEDAAARREERRIKRSKDKKEN